MRITPETVNLERAAKALGSLVDEMVFVGGSIVGILLTDPAAPLPRPTDDIDVIVEAATLIEYYGVEERMRAQGFSQDLESGVICRWKGHDLLIDVMPIDETILGFANKWYQSAIASAVPINLPGGAAISVIDGPHLLATKLEAFFGRGQGDLYASHDLEDIVLLLTADQSSWTRSSIRPLG